MKKKKIKHPSLKSLHRQAWKLFSEYVRRSERGVCFCCGVKKRWQETHAAHYIHRNSLDYDPINIHACCPRCNRFLHGNLGVYAERLIAEYGEEAIQNLRCRGNEVKKFTIIELKELIKKYTILLKELKGVKKCLD